MPRGRAPGFAAGRSLTPRSANVSPQARAAALYRTICDEDLPAEIVRDIEDRIMGMQSKYPMLRWNGVPQGSEVHELIPALLCMRFTDLPPAAFEELHQRLIFLMKGHISEFEQALAAADDPGNREALAKTFGLRHPERPEDVDEITRDLRVRLESIEEMTRESERHLSSANAYRMSILALLVNNALERELAAGHAETAHHLRVAQVASVPGGENERRRAFDLSLGRKCAAIARLDRAFNTQQEGTGDARRNWLMILGGRADLVEDELIDRLGHRLAGDHSERVLAKANRLASLKPSVCVDRGSALAEARGLLRNPYFSEVYRQARAATDGVRPRINVVVEPEVLRELDEQLRDSPGWRGYWVTAPLGSDLGDTSPTARMLLARGAQAVSLRLEVSEVDDSAEINFIAPIGQVTARGDELRMREIHGLAEECLGSRIAGELDLPSAPWEWNGKSIGLAERAVGQMAPAKETLGPDICDHSGASEWVPKFSLAPNICDTLTLRCSRCLRTRVASVPLHRLPPEHPVAARWLEAHGAAYLELEAAHSLLAGKRLCQSIEDLRSRDGMASLDPAAYASGVDRPRASVSSVSAAMRRR